MSNANIEILTLTVAALAEVVSYGQFVGFDGGPAGAGEPVLGVAKSAAGIGQPLAVINQGLAEVVGDVNIAAGDLVYSDAQGRPTTVGDSHPCGIAQRGGTVLQFGKESFRKINARRAPGTDTQSVQLGHRGKAFSLVQDALNGLVPREHLEDAQAVPGIDLAASSIRTVMNSMTLSLECEQAAIATNLDTYREGNRLTLAGGDMWSDPDSDPLAQIDAAKDAVRARIGAEPNSMVLSKPGFNALKKHPKIKEQFKYTSRESITIAMLAAYFELEKLAVGKSVILDSADEDAGFSDVWGNAYVPTDTMGFEEPSFGYTYRLKGHPFVEQPYWDNSKKSWAYGVTFDRLPLLTGVDAGFLFKGVV